MKPGDAITCASCRAHARIWSTGAQHEDGWPVLVSWATPDGERTMVESTGTATRQLTCRACGSNDPRAVVVHSRSADGTFKLPGAGGGDRTSPKEDAARVNAASGGKELAAPHGGDAVGEVIAGASARRSGAPRQLGLGI